VASCLRTSGAIPILRPRVDFLGELGGFAGEFDQNFLSRRGAKKQGSDQISLK
jgi:hypothetical protein